MLCADSCRTVTVRAWLRNRVSWLFRYQRDNEDGRIISVGSWVRSLSDLSLIENIRWEGLE
ncbi:MAG: hypothetical protein ACLU18_16480 [Bacteroides thetaiotaomicron]